MSIRVYPGAKSPTHEISLSDGVRKWGLRLDGGPSAISEVPMSASTIQFSGGGTKFGDWEPGMSHIEQRTWEGGRGQEEFVDDPTRYFDARSTWTLTGGKALPAPQWQLSRGYVQSYGSLPGSVGWQPLTGNTTWLSVMFAVGDQPFDIERVFLWLRRIGSPGELRFAMFSDQNGSPGLELSGSAAQLSSEQITDVISEFAMFDLSSFGSLDANTNYHVVLSASENDSAANHWEVGIDRSLEDVLICADGLAWEPGNFGLYFYAAEAAVERKWHCFLYKEALYAADQRSDGAPSKLYLNGDRGLAVQGTATSLSDSTKDWSADCWAGAWVCISEGTGKGCRAEITGNTNNTLTVTGWDTVPDSSSEYVIYGSPQWQDISPTSGDLIDGSVQDAAVVGDEVLLAQGMSVYILRMRWNPAGAPPCHEFADDGNRADIFLLREESDNLPYIWRAKKERIKISKAAVVNWGTPYSYDEDLAIGFETAPITNLVEHHGKQYVFKTDGRYMVNSDGSVEKSIGEIGFFPSANNGEALLSQGIFLYFSWGGFSLQRLYDSGYSLELSEVGPAAEGGLPETRTGKIGALAGHPGGILAAVDAGREKTSSVIMRPSEVGGWHEVFRAWQPGVRVNNLFWQQVAENQPRLWVSVGGELVYLDFPDGGFNPLQDSGMRYQHEAVLCTSTIDMGAARLPKFIKEFSALSDNLATGVEIHLDYQTDEEIGGSRWMSAGSFLSSPEDTLPIRQGNVRRIRLRLRMVTEESEVPPVLQATVLEGYARTPMKYQWNMRIKLGDCQPDLTGGADHDPDAFLNWLKDAARQARAIRMRSIWEQLDDKVVIVEPPTLLRSFTNKLLGVWGGSMTLTLRES